MSKCQIVIADTKLFNELKNITGGDDELWSCLFDILDPEYPEKKNKNIPALCGGLSHTIIHDHKISFIDIGYHSGGKLHDNSFHIITTTN